MIRCRKCKRFCVPVTLKVRKMSGEIFLLLVDCKQCGFEVEGEYDDYEELFVYFDMGDYQ